MMLDDRNEKIEFKIDKNATPIERLAPGSKHHEFVLDYLNKRIKISEDEMNKFYNRWRYSEKKQQAYMNLPNYEQILKNMNKSGEPAAPAIIVYPYQYAVISTIVTYMSRVFCGRKPMFQVGATNEETAKRYRQMETVLQYQADMQKLVAKLFQFFLDGELYGVAVVRNIWRTRKAKRAMMRVATAAEVVMGQPQGSQVKDYQERIIYQGADIQNIDPFMFLPDPSVPMADVAEKGEWVFWRNYIGKHSLLKDEQAGYLNYVSAIPATNPQTTNSKWYNLSNRNLMSEGNAHAGSGLRKASNNSSVIQFDQGSVEIISSELGLGESSVPEKWIFAIGNGTQILQAERLSYDHQCHPVSVAEPYTMGYGFGQPSMGDYLGPIQDIISWFIDSHIYNVRASLNNMFIYDPSKIEGQDLKSPKPGKLIRLKASAVGADVRTVLQQLPVADVTRSHMTDLGTFLKIGDIVSAVNDNMRGVQTQAGRKTATEVRTSGESAASRLASHAQFYSAQAITGLAQQMCLNTQQFQSEEMYLQILGQSEYAKIAPSDLMGDFMFPIHDGTLPLDRIAALDIWKEILQGVAADQELRMTHSLPKLFEFVAELGGAVNITSFRTAKFNLMADGELQQQVQDGNMVPVNELPPPNGGMPQMPNGAG